MKNSLLLAVISVLLLAGCAKINQNTAQWRGVNRDGIYKESGLLKVWPAEGPKLLWETEAIGNGYGSPVIYDKMVFINGEVDSIGHLFSFDLSGKLIWDQKYGREFVGEGFSSGFPGSRATPTVYKGLVYVCSGLGQIICFDAKTGKEIWSKHMVKDMGGLLNYFGYSESLLADENYLYCFPGGRESNIVCLDRLTGNTIWTSKALSDDVAFTSPMMIKLAERNLFVTLSKNNLFALDAKNGEVMWTFKEDSVKGEGAYCNTPLYENGFIYGISGIDKGTGAYKLQLSTDGKTIKEIWRNSEVKNGESGFVKIGDYIYSASEDKKLKSIDSNTGLVADSLKNLRGSVIAADNQLFCYGDNGNMNLIGLNGSKMELKSKFKVEKGTKEHLAHPVIDNGVLYLRHGKALMAYQIK